MNQMASGFYPTPCSNDNFMTFFLLMMMFPGMFGGSGSTGSGDNSMTMLMLLMMMSGGRF